MDKAKKTLDIHVLPALPPSSCGLILASFLHPECNNYQLVGSTFVALVHKKVDSRAVVHAAAGSLVGMGYRLPPARAPH
ncbi:hypothetical protein L210DRAFT_3524819 [Boletus edulis BED1]|uniref:Uncharacterized protein n=1 Tax=Boletus edulis BED1 TaxID=1328754 RepID=A0AAD4C5Z0_BOLED|nr:hypothetical protein L210DRAFT_3524819 [Boletus edulis BED1]